MYDQIIRYLESILKCTFNCSVNMKYKLAGFPCYSTQLVKNVPAMQETPVDSWVRKIPWRRERLPTQLFLSFPGALDSKESACNAGDLGSIADLGISPGGGHGNPI